ncbi:hypothetical protein HDU80_000294 [Chytriomyces hyalinus]|nr:hypothetical protein HDU80_000294 [Chytriomyces hyalinus]
MKSFHLQFLFALTALAGVCVAIDALPQVLEEDTSSKLEGNLERRGGGALMLILMGMLSLLGGVTGFMAFLAAEIGTLAGALSVYVGVASTTIAGLNGVFTGLCHAHICLRDNIWPSFHSLAYSMSSARRATSTTLPPATVEWSMRKLRAFQYSAKSDEVKGHISVYQHVAGKRSHVEVQVFADPLADPWNVSSLARFRLNSASGSTRTFRFLENNKEVHIDVPAGKEAMGTYDVYVTDVNGLRTEFRGARVLQFDAADGGVIVADFGDWKVKGWVVKDGEKVHVFSEGAKITLQLAADPAAAVSGSNVAAGIVKTPMPCKISP